MKTTKIILAVSIILIGLVLVSVVGAFGVVDIAGEKMYPGETKVVQFNIQNRAGATDDVLARLELMLGQEVASIEQTEYLVPAGGDVNVPITIKIHENASIGSSYIISVKTRTVAPGTAGAVGMGISMSSSFGVEVIAKPAPTITPPPKAKPEEIPVLIPVIIAAVIIIIIFIIAVILKRRKKGRKK